MKYIVDTNVLLQKPEIIKEHDCVISSHVLREIEHLERTRKSDRQLQYEIRTMKRYLDNNQTHVYIDLDDYKFNLSDKFDSQYVDNILLQVAKDNGYGMISNDRLMTEKCKLYNIEVMKINENNFIEHKGFQTIELTETQLHHIAETPETNIFELLTGEYMVVNDRKDGELLDILKWTEDGLVSVSQERPELFKGLSTIQFGELNAKDEFQIMAMDSILSNQITQIRGKAGSGKSLITLHTAWHLVEKEQFKLVIFVNPVPSKDAQELGFYKGDKFEKLMQTSVGNMLKAKFGDDFEIMKLIDQNKIDILPFVDLRGYDTGDKTIVWIVESQNLTKELAKLGLQRVGEGSKVIIDGDYHQQIDSDVYVSDNGMKRISEVFRGTELYGEVELQNVWRSRIAEIAEFM
jgi:PhoH-like ATPase